MPLLLLLLLPPLFFMLLSAGTNRWEDDLLGGLYVILLGISFLPLLKIESPLRPIGEIGTRILIYSGIISLFLAIFFPKLGEHRFILTISVVLTLVLYLFTLVIALVEYIFSWNVWYLTQKNVKASSHRAIILIILFIIIIAISPNNSGYIKEAVMAKVSSNYDEAYRSIKNEIRKQDELAQQHSLEARDVREYTLNDWITVVNPENRAAPDGSTSAYALKEDAARGVIGIILKPGKGVVLVRPAFLGMAPGIVSLDFSERSPDGMK